MYLLLFKMRERKSTKLNQQQQELHHHNGHLSPFNLAKLLDPDASWDKARTLCEKAKEILMQESNVQCPDTKQGGSLSLREESISKKLGNVNAKTMCKIDHLKNLVTEAAVPSIAAFFGERLAATTESLGLRGDPSSFVCERCETILRPGDNCAVRIEKNKSKEKCRRKKSNRTVQNNIVYRCHFCSHRNLMRGTPKGYVKEICPPKPKQTLKVKKGQAKCPSLEMATSSTECRQVDSDALLGLDGQNLDGLSLLDSKRRKRNRSSAKKAVEAVAVASILCSSKRRKKSWTSLKEIAESSGQRKLEGLKPFHSLFKK